MSDAYVRLRSASCPDPNAADGFYCISAGARLTGVRAGDPRPFETQPAGAASRLVSAGGLDQDEGIDTTHLTVADRWGNVVSYTTTVDASLGTGLMVPGFGFLLNNELTDFNLAPQRRGEPEDAEFDPGANDIGPGKRPRSSMAPTMIFAPTRDGERPVAAFGSPGGASIINTVLGFTLDVIDFRLPAAAAEQRPRLSLTKAADDAATSIEPGFSTSVLHGLERLGYRFETDSKGIGAVQAVFIDPPGCAHGAADPRRNGAVIGLAPASRPN